MSGLPWPPVPSLNRRFTPTGAGSQGDRTGHSPQRPLSKVQAESGRCPLPKQTQAKARPSQSLRPHWQVLGHVVGGWMGQGARLLGPVPQG